MDAVTGESDTTNNCSGSVSVVVSESPPQTNPDLAVGSPTVSDSSPTTGATFTLSATVRNDGDGAAEATTLRYYRSTDGTITTSDTSVGTDAVGGLSAGATSPESISLSAPSSAGTYYYGACVDTVTGESDTTNNCSSAVSVTVSAPPPPPPQTNPDLEVQSPSVNDSSPGYRRLVHPVGDGAQRRRRRRGGDDAALLPVDRRDDYDLRHLGGHGRGWWGLSAGATSPESISLSAPSSAGTYYYGAGVDTVTGESDTTNNCSSAVSVTVSAPPPPPPQTNPDLEVQSPSVNDSSLDTGDSVHPVGDGAQRRRRRRGGDDAALLPVDRRDDYDLRHLGGHGRGGWAFRRGDEPRVDQPVGAVVGGHVLLRRVRGHGDGRVGHDETTARVPCRSLCRRPRPPPPPPAGPDLTVHGIITVTSLDGTPPGGSFQLGASVENQGDEPSAATTGRYYHSTDATITTSDTGGGHGHRRGAIRWSDHQNRDLCHRAGRQRERTTTACAWTR